MNILRKLCGIYMIGLMLIFSCGGIAEEPSPGMGAGAQVDMLRLKRFDVVDQQGFGQPLTVVSFLAPADWRLEGGVQWNFNTECTMEIVTMQARVVSPDGRESFEIFPAFSAFWSENTNFNQFVGAKGCRVIAPFSSAEFIEKIFLPGFRQGATIAGKEALPDLARAEYEKQMAYYAPILRQLNATAQTEVTRAHLKFQANGGAQEEWVVAIVHAAISRQVDQYGWGGSYQVFTTEASQVVSFQAPAGQLQARKSLFATIMGSYRVNPAYLAAVRNVRQKMNQQAIQGLINRQKIIQSLNQQVQASIAANGQNMMDSWKRRNDSSDRSHEKWIEMIRGTDTYKDPHSSGTSWELNAGFKNVWKTASDEFIMTNDVNFNPNVTSGSNQDWSLMTRQR